MLMFDKCKLEEWAFLSLFLCCEASAWISHFRPFSFLFCDANFIEHKLEGCFTLNITYQRLCNIIGFFSDDLSSLSISSQYTLVTLRIQVELQHLAIITLFIHEYYQYDRVIIAKAFFFFFLFFFLVFLSDLSCIFLPVLVVNHQCMTSCT